MYEPYWKLREKPFENTPDPRFIYLSQRHEEALSRMFYIVQEKKGAAMLTGEYGCGKTLLCRYLFKELSSELYKTVFIFNPHLQSIDLVKEIIYQLDGDISNLVSRIDLMHRLNEILYRNKNEDKTTVVVIDEAQAIPDDSIFEELRLLLNFQLNDNFLMSFILLGQPELKARVDKLVQLKQRLSVRYHLTALSQEETEAYVKHRLEIAQAQDEIFQEDSFKEIYRYSGGVPRRINNICDMALLVGYSEDLPKITKETIIDVAEDLEEIPIDISEKTGLVIDG